MGLKVKTDNIKKMKYLKPEASDTVLKTQIGEVKNSDDAIKKFFKFFQENKIKEKLEDKEEDMMLFQYGNYDWQDGKGKEFSFDLTRQFDDPNQDEFIQLSLVLYYDVKEIGEIESFNSWSTEVHDLKAWETLIKGTKGYKKSKNLTPKRFQIYLERT